VARKGLGIEIVPYNTHVHIGVSRWEKGFRSLLQLQIHEINDYFENFTRAFTRHEVSITQNRGVRRQGGNMNVVVGVLNDTASNRVFSYVNYGTGPRIIYPRNYPYLMFRPGYKRATRPGSLIISPPWEKKGSYIYLRSVTHPGIRARRFDKLIQALMKSEMEYSGRKAVVALAKRTWKR